MTIMFTDIRSFASISEKMTYQQVFDFVNSYYEQVSPIIRTFKGFIVKYMGDGIMAVSRTARMMRFKPRLPNSDASRNTMGTG